MRIKQGLAEHPSAARGLGMRRALRRALYGPAFTAPDGGRHRLEDLGRVDVRIAVAFRPELRPEVQLQSSSLTIEPFEIELEPFELAVVTRCDGRLSAGEIAIVAANSVSEGRPDDPIAATLALLGQLAEFNALLPSEQPR